MAELTDSVSSAPKVTRKRRYVLAVIAVVVVVALIGGTWWLATVVQSPAQREAQAAAPAAKPVVAAVTQGELRDEITANATVSAASTFNVALPLGAGTSVVTAQNLAVGQQLTAGQVILHVNGRPLIALPGAFPAYRDLVQGDSGDDVVQLQKALIALGYALRADGDFGAATANALKHLYASVGYDLPTASVTDTGASAAASTSPKPSASEPTTAADTPPATAETTTTAATNTNTKTVAKLPQAEVVYVPQLESAPTVNDIPAQGQVLDAASAVIKLSSGAAHVEAQVPATTANALKAGAKAHFTSAAGSSVSLTLSEVRADASAASTATDAQNSAATANSGQQDSTQMGSMQNAATDTLVFTADDPAALPAVQTPLVLTIERTPTIVDTLLVPKRALATAANSTSSVLKREANGSFTAVSVTLQACVGGQCAVSSPKLAVGDQLKLDAS